MLPAAARGIQDGFAMHVGHIIIIGAMKAGTTTLHNLLSQHSQITMSHVNGYKSMKELDYFLQDRGRSYDRYFRKGPPEGTWTLEASPSYSKNYLENGCAERIAALKKQKKLVYILRDPIDRIDSQMSHNVSRGRTLPEPRALRVYSNTSRYWSHIQRFDAAGLSDSLLLLDFDDLCQDPVGTARKVQEFVGLGLEDPADVRVHNSRRTAGRVLTEEQERSYWARVRPDVRALAASGRFPAAQKWLDTWSAKFGRSSPRRRSPE